jgi:AcrR family transcriptional regulator
MRDVIAASGAAVGTAYHHFPAGLPDLKATLYFTTLAAYQDAYLAELQRHQRAELGVKASVRFHLEWIASDIPRARYLFSFDADVLTERDRVGMARMNERFVRAAADWRKPFVKARQIRRLPPLLYGAVLLGPAHLHANREIDGPSGGDAPGAIRGASRVLADVAWLSLKGEHG